MSSNLCRFSSLFSIATIACVTSFALGQSEPPKKGNDAPNEQKDAPPNRGFPGGFPGFGGPPDGFRPGGFGGPPGFGGPQRSIVAEFDANEDGWLNASERSLARKSDKNKQQQRRMPFPPGGEDTSPATAGRALTPDQVKTYQDEDLYDPHVLRTLFLTFENEDWEKELEEFHGSDVDVSAKLVVDGKEYDNVGVHFRGLSSYMQVQAGKKRSLNVSMDLADSKQRLLGAKTLNLLNSHEDDSMMSSVLYSHIARQFIPAPKANFVQVVINGECWGVYSNLQQFDKEFLRENYGSSKGARWKVKGMPFADSGLRYLGEDVNEYKSKYSLKSADDPQAWKDLIHLCKVLDETPQEDLEQALQPILDIDSVLRFLAIDVALVNNDGYWVRASDYNLLQDTKGLFHLIPHDMNEALSGTGPHMRFGRGRPGGGPGGRSGPGGRPGFGPPGSGGPGFGGPGGPGPGGPGGRGMMGGDYQLDPLVGLDDDRKPLRSKLLAVPSLKKKYLEYIRTIAEHSMAEQAIAPVIEGFRSLIAEAVELDTRKLASFEAFSKVTSSEKIQFDPKSKEMSLLTFFSQRRKVLLNNEEVSKVQAATFDAKSKIKSRPQDEDRLKSRPAGAPKVIINEWMASNSKTFKDPQGHFDDWIELHNLTDSPITLDGMYLSDSEQSPRKWSFPKGTSIVKRGYLIVWADDDKKSTDGLHVNFKLSSQGETLFLIDTDANDNAVIDRVEFGKQHADISSGREPRDTTGAVHPLSPTPGKENQLGE